MHNLFIEPQFKPVLSWEEVMLIAWQFLAGSADGTLSPGD